MRLLYSAYCAGVRTYLSSREHHAALNTLAEDAPMGALIFDAIGHPIAENPFFRRLMSGEPERDRVRAAAAQFVVSMLAGRYASTQHRLRRTSTEIETYAGCYRLAATFFADEFSPDAGRVIVFVDKVAALALDANQLGHQYSLTGRQIEIAQLVRKGRSPREIASALGITLNTTRRHLERVYLKLDVHSRASAAAKLAGGDR
jgi:DNA-binding CsgD family transcriptional regulator